MAGRERRIQANAGGGNPEGGRADQPHAVAAADTQQFRSVRPANAGGDHDQGLDPPPPAFLGDPQQGSRGHGDNRQVNVLGQRGDRRHAADALQVAPARIDCMDRAGEPPVMMFRKIARPASRGAGSRR